jgi:hypothetical protein
MRMALDTSRRIVATHKVPIWSRLWHRTVLYIDIQILKEHVTSTLRFNLKSEKIYGIFPEMLVSTCKATWCHNPEVNSLKLRPRIYIYMQICMCKIYQCHMQLRVTSSVDTLNERKLFSKQRKSIRLLLRIVSIM